MVESVLQQEHVIVLIIGLGIVVGWDYREYNICIENDGTNCNQVVQVVAADADQSGGGKTKMGNGL